ncbi:SDR family oxidoreductase [Nonomuraea muscovyensis]|uniref:SDR family oxidoreductase n=1 Tax=Nonomuraea muscovyensis TaxID=1124761 RepID=UPI0033F925B2|nr:2-hydroxycyclohexanecarboxyl-CoA dehydrogenase [Nonomuraea muscovyensis]
MSRPLDGKVALVTGGSRGIGRAIAERLGRDGAVVAVAYAREAVAAKEVVKRIEESGGRAFAIRAELGGHGDAVALWDAFDAAVGEFAPGAGVDVIVNNAAIATSSDLDGLTEEEFDQVFAVNVRAPFFIVREALRRGLRDGGRIVNISSGVTRIALPGVIAYSATKGALDVFTLTLAKQLGPRGITVNSVAPGYVETDVNAGWLSDPEAAAQAAAASTFGRIGQPDDIAGVVAFLASDDARWVTGRVVDATGGSQL